MKIRTGTVCIILAAEQKLNITNQKVKDENYRKARDKTTATLKC